MPYSTDLVHGTKPSTCDQFQPQCMDYLCRGMTVPEIYQQLTTDHGKLPFTQRTLQNACRQWREDIRDDRIAVLADKVAKSDIDHVSLYEKSIIQLDQEADASFKAGNKIEAVKMLDTRIKIQQLHLSLLGLDKPRPEIEIDLDVLVALAGK